MSCFQKSPQTCGQEKQIYKQFNLIKMSESKEIIKPTAADVIDLFQNKLGKDPKQMKSLTFEVSETPLSGTIYKLNDEPETYKDPKGVDHKYAVYSVMDSNGNHIGVISVNRFFDTKVVKDDVIVIASEANKGRAMLRSHRLTSTNKFGKSRAEQIANLVGASYEGERTSVYQPIEYIPAKLFSAKKSYKLEKEVEQAVKDLLWKNTEINEKAMTITFV